MKNCNACKHINITEKEQQIFKHTDHRCTKYRMRVVHDMGNPKILHSYIYPCHKCNGDDFELKEGIEYEG